MIMLRITIALALGTTGAAWAQQPSDPALKNLNACLTTQRAQPSTEEEIFKSLDVAIIDPDRVAVLSSWHPSFLDRLPASPVPRCQWSY